MNKILTIGLLWHSNSSGNLGVGALTVSHLELIRRAASRAGVTPRLILFHPHEPSPPYVGGFAASHVINGRFMISPGGYWKEIGQVDLMLDIGAGDSFADIYPDKRFAYIIATKEYCFLKGVPLVLAPQTIGPFSRQPHISAARHVMDRAHAVFARDPLSFDVAKQMAPEARVHRAIDVAFALPYTRPDRPGSDDQPLRVGVNVSGLLYSGGYSGANDYGLTIDYRAYTDQLVAAFLQRGAQVELIAHVNTSLPRDDDGAACDIIHDRYPEAVRVPAFASPSAAKSHISGLDFLVAGRMHASIAAWSSGVPVVPVSYSRKFEGLYGSLSYPWLVPAKGFTTAEALAFTLDAFDRRAELRADIVSAQPVVDANLETYVGWLADTFQKLTA